MTRTISLTAALTEARNSVYTVGGGYTITVEDADRRTGQDILCYEGDGYGAVRKRVTVLRAAEACRLLGYDYRAAKMHAEGMQGDLASRVKKIMGLPCTALVEKLRQEDECKADALRWMMIDDKVDLL